VARSSSDRRRLQNAGLGLIVEVRALLHCMIGKSLELRARASRKGPIRFGSRRFDLRVAHRSIIGYPRDGAQSSFVFKISPRMKECRGIKSSQPRHFLMRPRFQAHTCGLMYNNFCLGRSRLNALRQRKLNPEYHRINTRVRFARFNFSPSVFENFAKVTVMLDHFQVQATPDGSIQFLKISAGDRFHCGPPRPMNRRSPSSLRARHQPAP